MKEIITHARKIDQFDIKSLAFFYKVKFHFRNGTVYGCNKSIISRRTGVSYYLVSKFLKKLIEDGLVQIRNGNYFFISYYKIGEKCYKKDWEVLKNGSLQEIERQLQYILLKENYRQQKYVINKKLDIKLLQENEAIIYAKYDNDRKKAFKATKEAMKLRNKSEYNEKVYNKAITSVRKVSELFKVSLGKAWSILKDFVRLGWITLKEKKKRVSKSIPMELGYKPNNVKLGYFYNSNGYLWYSLGSELECIL